VMKEGKTAKSVGAPQDAGGSASFQLASIETGTQARCLRYLAIAPSTAGRLWSARSTRLPICHPWHLRNPRFYLYLHEGSPTNLSLG
jgi:hypothetical protein